MSVQVSAHKIGKSFGSRILFADLTLSLEEGQRLAIIGANGCGKSTLLRIVARLEEMDSGDVVYRRGVKIGFVTQQVEPFTATIEATLREAVRELDSVEQSIRISRWSKISGLGDLSRSSATLSGGWRKRLQLVRELCREPDVLLLDEPTNHLDIETIRWLETVMIDRSLTVAFVSHDRYFIERVATQVLEIGPNYPGGYWRCDGSYSDFLEKREALFEAREHQYAALGNKVRREIAWLRRGPKARTTKARGRIKSAEGLIEDFEAMRLPTERLRFDFAAGSRKTFDMVRLEGVSKRLGDKQLFTQITTILAPGSRLGLVGPNGSGKSTFLKVAGGAEPPTEGKVIQALGLRIRMFDQHRTLPRTDITLRELLCPHGDAVVFNDKQIHVQGWAKRFLFAPNSLGRPVHSLSGGEQARALLARFMLEPADLLLLDEPTNDLDIPTLEVFEDALTEFQGAIVVVSHDRFFLDSVCTSILPIEGAREARFFSSYSQWEEVEEQPPTESAFQPKPPIAEKQPPDPKQKRPLTYAERIELNGIEKQILSAEGHVAALESQLLDPELTSNQERLRAHCEELEEARRQVEAIYERWQFLETKKVS